MIPQTVVPFPSSTQMLHVTVSKEYALSRQRHFFHLDLLLGPDLLFDRIEHVCLISRGNSNRSLLRDIENQEIQQIILLASHETILPVCDGQCLTESRHQLPSQKSAASTHTDAPDALLPQSILPTYQVAPGSKHT